MTELKPCPFCGGTPHQTKSYNEYDEGTYYSYKCRDCGAKSGEKYARETCPIFYAGLRDDWNRRTDLSPRREAGGREEIARALCAEKCAVYGEPPCYTIEGEWPNPHCGDCTCHDMADVVLKLRAEPGKHPLTPLDTPVPRDFYDWWSKDGYAIDPEPDVSWYDKRRDFAELAFRAGRAPTEQTGNPVAEAGWNLTTTINVEVAIDESHTQNLNDAERHRLIDALMDKGASEVMHYATIIATFEDANNADALSAAAAALSSLTQGGE